MKEEDKWLAVYIASSWLSNFGHGMVVTVVGPMQPYLAFNVGVPIDTINLLWTAGFAGFTLGAVATGFVFRRFCTTNAAKMVFLWLTMFFNGALMTALPFIDSFAAMVVARCLQNVSLGAYITADTSLVVYTMGPIKSRPFTFALHSLIGAGFLAATFLVKPFLPDDDLAGSDGICISNETSAQTGDGSHNEPLLGLRRIAWPFIIAGSWCMLFSCGFAILSRLRYPMPVFYEVARTSEYQEQGPRVSRWRGLLLLTFFFYVITCGIERIYQPMAYTYGICGPLHLAPSAAVVIDQCYNGGFMAGRVSGIFVAKVLKPRTMVVSSLVLCIGSAALLVAVGTTSALGVYIGTCKFLILLIFEQAKNIKVTFFRLAGLLCLLAVWGLLLVDCSKGRHHWQGGAPLPRGLWHGRRIVPPSERLCFHVIALEPLEDVLFTNLNLCRSSWGPVGILHLTLIMCSIQLLLYSAMWMVSRKKAPFNIELEMK